MLQIAANSRHIPDDEQFIKWINILSQHINIDIELVTIRVVEVAEIQALNKQFRGKDKPTNVLSFPSQLPQIAQEEAYLGDLIICADIVEQEAIAQHKSFAAHWAHMLVHGILHLQGYDHINNDQAEGMEALEIDLLANLDYPNPYAV